MHDKLERLGFPLGTRVVMASPDPTGYVRTGQTGTVCHYTSCWEDTDGCNIGVQWDEGYVGYHDCSKTCKNGYGRYVPHTCLLPEGYDIDLGEIQASELSISALFDITS